MIPIWQLQSSWAPRPTNSETHKQRDQTPRKTCTERNGNTGAETWSPQKTLKWSLSTRILNVTRSLRGSHLDTDESSRQFFRSLGQTLRISEIPEGQLMANFQVGERLPPQSMWGVRGVTGGYITMWEGCGRDGFWSCTMTTDRGL